MTAVRCRTTRARTRCMAWRSSCSTDFVGTKRMRGRCTASATQMVRANARLHSDQARRYVGKPHNHQAAGQSAAQNDVPGAIEPDEATV